MTLDELAIKYGSDKCSLHHNYCPIYERYFAPLKDRAINLVELGIGGYHFPDRGGASLKMWYDYFQQAKIFGVDIHVKTGLNNDRIKTIRVPPDSDNLLVGTLTTYPPEIIIDDASHINALTIRSFYNLWPLLKPGGYYIVEDVHTSYWKENFDGDPDPKALNTTMAFLNSLTHNLNHETLLQEFKGDYAGQIEFIHFYKEIVIIKKV